MDDLQKGKAQAEQDLRTENQLLAEQLHTQASELAALREAYSQLQVIPLGAAVVLNTENSGIWDMRHEKFTKSWTTRLHGLCGTVVDAYPGNPPGMACVMPGCTGTGASCRTQVPEEAYVVRISDDALGTRYTEGEQQRTTRWPYLGRSFLTVCPVPPRLGRGSEVAEWRQASPVARFFTAKCQRFAMPKGPDAYRDSEWSGFLAAEVTNLTCLDCCNGNFAIPPRPPVRGLDEEEWEDGEGDTKSDSSGAPFVGVGECDFVDDPPEGYLDGGF